MEQDSELHRPRAWGNLESSMSLRGNRFSAGLTVVTFLGGITFPLVGWALHGIPAPGRLPEERHAHTRPAPPRDLARLSTFARDFEAWFGDVLGGRRTLLSWRSFEYVTLFGLSATPVVRLGRDRWVFLVQGHEFEMQRGADPLSRFELEAWVTAIRARKSFCRAQGAEYVFALAPDKTGVYTDRCPLAFRAIGPSRTDQLLAAFENDPVILDLRPSQLRAKERDATDDHAYFPFGTHWTDRGAAAGVRAIGEHVRQWPRVARWLELKDEDIVWGPRQSRGDSWADRLYLSGVLRQSEPVVESLHGPEVTWDAAVRPESLSGRATTDDPTLPSVVMFHDSYGQAACKFLARSTSRFVAEWDNFKPELVTANTPDLVIELFVERTLARPPIENLAEQLDHGRRVFAAARPRFVMDLARDVGSVGAQGGVEARIEAHAILVRWTNPTALAALPAAVLPPSGHAVVRLEVEVKESVQASFHYKTGSDPTYSRGNAITKMLPAGRSEVFLDLGLPDIVGPIAFRLHRPLEFKLYACESRLLE
jgi:hypothetical protein